MTSVTVTSAQGPPHTRTLAGAFSLPLIYPLIGAPYVLEPTAILSANLVSSVPRDQQEVVQWLGKFVYGAFNIKNLCRYSFLVLRFVHNPCIEISFKISNLLHEL
jgi:hypothetical protein